MLLPLYLALEVLSVGSTDSGSVRPTAKMHNVWERAVARAFIRVCFESPLSVK